MNISLATIDVWEIAGNFDAASLLKALSQICTSTDILVVGAYNPSGQSMDWLRSNEIQLSNDEIPFQACGFEMNRAKYPLARAYPLHPTDLVIDDLCALAKNPGGSVDKDEFFDHILIYRPGTPVIPLMNFHDAFSGGSLYISGHFSLEAATSFSALLEATAKSMLNPEIENGRQTP